MLSKVYIKKTINIYFLFLIIYKPHIKAVEIRNLTMENFKANEFLRKNNLPEIKWIKKDYLAGQYEVLV